MSGQDKVVIENVYRSIQNNERKAKRDRKIKRPVASKIKKLELRIVK